MKAMCSWQTIRSRRCVDRRYTPTRPPGAAGRRCPAAARAATGPGSRPHRARGAVLAFAVDRGRVKAAAVEVRQLVRRLAEGGGRPRGESVALYGLGADQAGAESSVRYGELRYLS